MIDAHVCLRRKRVLAGVEMLRLMCENSATELSLLLTLSVSSFSYSISLGLSLFFFIFPPRSRLIRHAESGRNSADSINFALGGTPPR